MISLKSLKMSVIERLSKDYLREIRLNAHSIERLDGALSSKLLYIESDSDKLEILRSVRAEVKSVKDKHDLTCTTKNCSDTQKNENALFVLDQKIKSISSYFEPQISEKEEFSSEEENDLYDILNEILSKFDRMDKGQEIIFNEIDELKQHFNLGKKSWVDLAAGKLIRLAGAGIMETDDAKMILKSLGDEIISPFKVFLDK